MPECQDLIVEIGTEELPPMSLNKMAMAFMGKLQAQLETKKVLLGNVH